MVDTSSPQSAGGPLAKSAPDPDRVPELNWAEHTYDLSCWDEPQRVTLHDGQFIEAGGAGFYELGDVVHLDVDDDGIDEVAVPVTCQAGAHGHVEQILLYAERETGFRRIGRTVSGPNVRQDGEDFIVNEAVYGESDALCCPAGYEDTRYHFSTGSGSYIPIATTPGVEPAS